MKITGTLILIALLFPFILPDCTIYAQSVETDSVKVRKIRFDISGGFYLQNSIKNGAVPYANIPTYLSNRRAQEPDVARFWGLNNNESRASDNPLGHGPSYWRFHSWYDLSEHLQIYGSLTFDHRGFSFAPYNTQQVAFLPRYHVTYNNSFLFPNFSKDSVSFGFKLGTFEDYKNYEGLMMYNIDVQGLQGWIQWRKLTFTATTIGDLQFGIGLNLDGLRDYQFGIHDLSLIKNWKAVIKAGVQGLNDADFPRKVDIVSFSAAVYRNQIRIYSEAGYRFSDYGISPSLNYSWLAGISNKIDYRKISLSYALEYRHYGGGFNYQLRDELRTHYRKIGSPPGNFIGDYVYPISFLNRPFNQWAVFTEYDKQWVEGASLISKLKYKLGKSFYLLAETDFNLITAQGEEPFLYPFFKIGLQFETLKETFLAFTITNKTMNLDKAYTTYYFLREPVVQLELRRDIKL